MPFEALALGGAEPVLRSGFLRGLLEPIACCRDGFQAMGAQLFQRAGGQMGQGQEVLDRKSVV